MSALHEAGRTAEALQAYTAARAALDELGVEPGEEPATSPGRDSPRRGDGPSLDERSRRARRGRRGRQGARLRSRRSRPRPRRRRRSGRAARDGVRLPDRPADRPRARLAVRRDDERLGPALRRAPPALRGGCGAAGRAPLPGSAAAGAARARRPHQLIISTRYDLALERAFEDGRRGGRRRHVRRQRPVPRQVLAPRARARSRARSTSRTPTRPSSRSSAEPSSSSSTVPSIRSRSARGRAS